MARTPGETQLVEQEQWLRSNGLPLVVPPTRRLRGLVPRTAPLLVTLALPATGLVMVDAAVSAQDGVDLFDILRRPAALSAVIAAGLVIVLAIPLGVAHAALQRRMTPTARLVVGLVIIVFWVVGLSVIATLTHATQGLHVGILERLGLLLMAALIGFYGLGNMASWAGRRGARELAVTGTRFAPSSKTTQIGPRSLR